MRFISVVGARPNFIKVAALSDAILKHNSRNGNKIEHQICHTGQHYDTKMSKVFFSDLELPKPNFYLGVGSGSHAVQTAKIMIEFEKVLIEQKPELVIVVGDVNSTIACSLTAVKMGIKVAHVEAGLRSFDRSMPEEINRILTDSISDFLFVTEKSGTENLIKEGIDKNKIFFVGNVMIDTLIKYLPAIENLNLADDFSLNGKGYGVITLHRPSNVDEGPKLKIIIDLLNKLAESVNLIFPVHPRTKKHLVEFGLINKLNQNIVIKDPVSYLEFISLVKSAKFVLTDSGGIQEETTFLGIPCITLRTTTERPITVEVGTNYLVGEDNLKALEYIDFILDGKSKVGKIPELWDGKASERIIQILAEKIHRN